MAVARLRPTRWMSCPPTTLPSHHADAPHGGQVTGLAEGDVKALLQVGVDDLVRAGDDQEEDKAQRGQGDDGLLFEGGKSFPVEDAFHRAGGFLDLENHRNGYEGEDRQQQEDSRPGDVLRQQAHHRSGDDHTYGAAADHEGLDGALFVFRNGIQSQAVSAGVIKGHAHLQHECDGDKAPVVFGRVNEGNQDQTQDLDEETEQDVRLTVPHAKQVDLVGEHPKEDLDHEGDHRDRGEDAHRGHREAAREEIEGVQGGEVTEDSALGKVQGTKHGITDKFLLGHGLLLGLLGYQ